MCRGAGGRRHVGSEGVRHRGVTHSWGISGGAFGQSPLGYLKPRKRSGAHALPPQKRSSRSILWGGGVWVTTGPLEWKLASVDLPEVQPDLGPSQGPPASGCLQEVDPLWTSSSSWSPHGRLGTPLGCARTPSASAAPSPSHVCILSLSEPPPQHLPTSWANTRPSRCGQGLEMPKPDSIPGHPEG